MDEDISPVEAGLTWVIRESPHLQSYFIKHLVLTGI